MLSNDLNNKIKKMDALLDSYSKDAQEIFTEAMSKANSIDNKVLKEMSLDLLRKAKAGEKVNIEQYIKEASKHAN